MPTTVRIKAQRVAREKNGTTTFAPAGYYAASLAVGGATFEWRGRGEKFTIPTKALRALAEDRAIVTLDGAPWPILKMGEPPLQQRFNFRAA